MGLKELLYSSTYIVREIEMGKVDVPEKGGKSKLVRLGRTYWNVCVHQLICIFI